MEASGNFQWDLLVCHASSPAGPEQLPSGRRPHLCPGPLCPVNPSAGNSGLLSGFCRATPGVDSHLPTVSLSHLALPVSSLAATAVSHGRPTCDSLQLFQHGHLGLPGPSQSYLWPLTSSACFSFCWLVSAWSSEPRSCHPGEVSRIPLQKVLPAGLADSLHPRWRAGR